MTSKTNSPATRRDFVFTPAGNDDWSGVDLENAVTSPMRAIELVNALSPPPSSFNPASISAAETGTYLTGVTMPRNTAANCSFVAIVTTDPVAVAVGDIQFNQWGALRNDSDNGICALIDGKRKVVLEVSLLSVGSDGAVFPESTGNIGVETKGVVDDIFIDSRQIVLKAIDAIGFKHTATSTTPVSYKEVSGEFFNVNQTMVHYDSPVGQQVDVTLGKVTPSAVAIKPVTGSTVLRVISGTLSVRASTLQAVTVAIISANGLLSLNAVAAIGAITLEEDANSIMDITFYVGTVTVAANARLVASFERYFGSTVATGEVIYNTIGIYSGNLETTATGRIALTGSDIIGDALNEGDMSLVCDNFTGDITNNGTMYVVIGSHIGSLTNNGTINGIINGVRYGNWIVAAEDVTYNNTISGLDAEDVQAAIDELSLPLPFGSFHLKQNVAVTVISAANTFTDINGAATASPQNHLFSLTTTPNVLTSLSEKTYNGTAQVNSALRRNMGASNRDYALALYQDTGSGYVQIAGAEANVGITTIPRGASFGVGVTVSEDDKFKVMVENRTTADDIIVDYDVKIIPDGRY